MSTSYDYFCDKDVGSTSKKNEAREKKKKKSIDSVKVHQGITSCMALLKKFFPLHRLKVRKRVDNENIFIDVVF